MIISIIFLMTSECLKALLIALAMCLIPALLGWLAAQSYFKVGELREKVTALSAEVGTLTGKVNTLAGDNTDLRVKLTQADAEAERLRQLLSKHKNDLIIVESERNILRQKMADLEAGTGAPKKAAAAPAVAAAAAAIMFAGTKYKTDDLKIVEGIGAKIEGLLHDAGIKTWKGLSEATADHLKEILDAAGPNYQIHDPGTWPRQAGLADNGDWDGLKKLQDELDGGKENS